MVRRPYAAVVDLNEDQIDAVRERATYRAALWVARAQVVDAVVWCSVPAWVPFQPRAAPTPMPVVVIFVVAAVLGLVSLLLLGLAGAPMRRGSIGDAGVLWAFTRDIFWYRRPYRLPDDWEPPR